jgi:CheY-like chemotaxis protein
VRFSFMFMLEGLGYAVAEAADGAAALECIAKQTIHVVLTDMYMPGMDGLGLVRAIRAMPGPRPFVILMSGSVDASGGISQGAALEPGADAVLRKPINRDKLLNTIRSLQPPPDGAPRRGR